MLIVFEVNFKLPIIRILLIFGRGEELHDFILGEQGTAQNSGDRLKAASQNLKSQISVTKFEIFGRN